MAQSRRATDRHTEVSESGPVKRRRELLRLFAALACDTMLFQQAKVKFTDTVFGPDCVGLQLYWNVLRDAVVDAGSFPEIIELRELVSQEVTNNPIATDAELNELDSLLVFAAQLREKPSRVAANHDKNLGRMKDFLDESAKRDLDQAMHGSDQTFETLLRTTQKRLIENATVEATLFQNPLSGLLIPGARPAVRLVPTYVEFVDKMTVGGFLGGETCGHLAAIGSGKSTLCMQIAVNRARAARKEAIGAGKPPRIVYLFVYEDFGSSKLQFYSNAARIPKDTVGEYMTTQNLSVFSTRTTRNYKEYELRSFATRKEGLVGSPPGEYERLQRAERELADSLMLVDFSGGNPAFDRYCTDYVEGIANFIEAHQEFKGKPGVDFVLVDYAKLVASRYLRAASMRPDDLRRLIDTIPSEMSNMIGVRYDCPCWVPHQLAGEVQKLPPGRIPDVSQGSETRMYHENCSFAFVTSRLTKDSIAGIELGKRRRVGAVPPEAIRLIGNFSRWECALTFSVQANAVVSKSDLAAVSDNNRRLFGKG